MEKLFNSLSEQGKYTKSFEDFQTQFGNEEGQAKLYQALNASGDYTKSQEDFTKQFFVTDPVKTNDSASADPAVESSESVTDSKSENSLSAWQSIKNSFSNVGEQVGDVFEFWFDTNEEEGGGARAALDIATNSVYAGLFGQDKVDQYAKEQGEDSWMASGLGTKNTLESIEKYKKEKLESKETLGIIESVKNGDVAGALAGGVNAVTSMIGSIAYGLGTAGAGFLMDYTAENFVEYNKLKAKNLGVGFDELLESGEADNAVPVGMGVVSSALELIGLGTIGKGVKGAVKGTSSTGLVGMGSKYLAEKLIYNKGARATMRMFSTGATEFTTEILQHAADKVNSELGRVSGTDKESEIFKTVIDAVTSQEGLEAGLQGFIGGGGQVAGTYSVKSMNTIRTVVDGDKINKNINELSVLRKQLNTTENKLVKEGVQNQINEKESEIADAVRKGNDIYNSLTDKQISEIENLTDLADAAAFKVTELNKQFRKNEISETQYNSAVEGFKSEYDSARKALTAMELEKNIEFAKKEAESKGLKFKVYETTKAIQGAVNKLTNISKEDRQEFKDSKGNIHGFAIGNQILINKEVAAKEGAINVGSHEVLHPVFNKLIGSVAEQGKIVKQFRRAMTSSQRSFVDKKMKELGYNTPKRYNTEYITVFSDALRKKQINYDKTTFEKIGNAIVSVFKPKGYSNVSFETGQDVYNFVKEFDASAEQGKMTEKAAAALNNVDLSKAGLKEDVSFSKTLTPEQSAELGADISAAKALGVENEAIAKKYGKEAIKGVKQTRLEQKVLSGLKDLIDKVITNRTKALYDPIADDAKRNVSRQEFKDSMRADLETMTLNEYNGSQELEKFIVNRGYLRANNLAKRLGIESQEDGGIKSDIETAKDIVSTKDEQSIDRSGTVERGQATFDELDIVDEALIEDIKKDLEKEIRVRVQKGTLSEMLSVKKGRETYMVSWLENYVNKQLFKKLLKKVGAITGVYPDAVIPGAYIDFLNDPKTFDIITKALPIKSIKKSYGKLFPMEKVGRELTAEGNPVYRIKPIDKKTFLTYFLKGKKSAVLERQKQLFREILEPLAKQVVADYATPENLSKLNEIKELASEGSIDVVNKIALEAQLNVLESAIDRYKGEQTGFDIIQFSNSINNYTDAEINSIRKVSGISSSTPKALVMVDAIVEIIKETISPTATKLKKEKKSLSERLGVDLFKKIEEDFLYPLSAAYELKKEKNEFGLGTASEQIMWDVYNKLPGIQVLSKRPKGYSGDTKPDLIIQNLQTKKQYIIEIKANKDARLVTFDVQNYDSKNPNVTRLTENSADSNSIIEHLGKDSPSNFLKKFLDKKNAYFAKNNIKSETDDNGNVIIDKDVLDILLGGDNLYTASRVFFKRTNEAVINDIYLNKGVSVISFLDIGNYNIKGADSMYNLPAFEADIKLRGYLKAQEIADTNKVKLRFKIIAEFLNAASSDVLTKTSTTPATSAISINKSVNKNPGFVIQPSKSGPLEIYHGGAVKSKSDMKGNFIYFSTDKAQAKEYAKGNDGAVQKFVINEENVVDESAVFEVIDKLGIQPADFESGWRVEDSNLYELIDDRFDQVFSPTDLKKLSSALKKKNIQAATFTDTDLRTGKDTDNIVVFDTDVIQFSKSDTEINEDFNNIIEGATGIKGFKVFSEAKGKVRGQNKGRFKFFIPPSADDFSGLMYRLLGKGKQGDANSVWFKTNLFDPFSKGIKDYETYKEQALHIVKALKKRIKKVPNSLGKTNETGFTNEVAVRVYLWAKNGHDIPGLSKTDQKDLVEIINNDKDLKDFAEELDQTFKGYPEPNNDWLAGTVTTDMINMVNTTKRAEFLEAWQEKVDVIFSKDNMNKLRAAYGNNYVEALQDMLYRMKTGRNRPSGANKMTNNFMNWFNDSVGTIMFFNTRSALLQTLSIANFINWGDNNPAKAAAAFANQKQFWADFSMLFNSNFLKQRRGGLKNDVNADDIARAAESSTNKARAVLSSILKMGFLPTQIADSFAIAMGGASFVRNRTKTYVSQGIDIKAAEEKAFLDFQEVTEETQQSSRPDRVSQQQASPLGRIILAFANTPMQYMRLTKKAFLDLKNGRGSAKTNISKIVYYTFVQNIIFSALQSALFAAAFDDDDDDKALQDKEVRIANSMLDSILRGVGIYGAIASTGKNIIMEIDRQSKKDRPDFTQAALKVVDLSPPLSSKVRKVMSTGRAFSYKSVREKMKGYGLDNPAYYAVGQSVSAITNIPLDRAVKKADNIRVAMDNDTKLWQSIALMLGYSQWDLGLVETSATKKKKSFGKTSKWKKSSSWKKSGNWK